MTIAAELVLRWRERATTLEHDARDQASYLQRDTRDQMFSQAEILKECADELEALKEQERQW